MIWLTSSHRPRGGPHDRDRTRYRGLPSPAVPDEPGPGPGDVVLPAQRRLPAAEPTGAVDGGGAGVLGLHRPRRHPRRPEPAGSVLQLGAGLGGAEPVV